MGADASEIRKIAIDLGAVGPQVRKRAPVVLRKSSFDIVASAKNRVPVDTGKLKGSIGATFLSPLSAEIGPTANYGFWVEVGTSRMAPQPYMGPAADIHFPLFEQAVAQLGEELLGG
jgi:HK97 gp10 family phage protein